MLHSKKVITSCSFGEAVAPSHIGICTSASPPAGSWCTRSPCVSLTVVFAFVLRYLAGGKVCFIAMPPSPSHCWYESSAPPPGLQLHPAWRIFYPGGLVLLATSHVVVGSSIVIDRPIRRLLLHAMSDRPLSMPASPGPASPAPELSD